MFRHFLRAWNNLQSQETPRLHRNMAAWLERMIERGERGLLLMVFRGAGKSTLVGLLAAWLLIRNPGWRILVVAADLTLAVKMVRSVRRILELHPACAGLKPKRPEQWAVEQFTVARPQVLRDPSMLARGLATNVTGSRADMIICDDVEVASNSDSRRKSVALRERLAELDYVLVPGGLQLYVGTPHARHSIYARTSALDEDEEAAPFLEGFVRFEAAILDRRGDSRWPERFTLDRIESIRRRSGPGKFSSQFMLRPTATQDGRFEPDRLRIYDSGLEVAEGNGVRTLRIEGRLMVSAAAAWDPAYGVSGQGDRSVAAAVFVDDDGRYYLHELSYHKVDPLRLDDEAEAIQLCRQVADFAERLFLPSIRVERNGIGAFLPTLLRNELNRRGVACAVIASSSSTSKDQRILDAFDARLAAGSLYAHRNVLTTPFCTELEEWRPGCKGPDDGMDAVAACLLAEPVRLRAVAPPRRRIAWRPGGETHVAPSTFEP